MYQEMNDTAVVSRSELKFLRGFLEGISWGVPEPFNEAVTIAAGMVEDMLTAGNGVPEGDRAE